MSVAVPCSCVGSGVTREARMAVAGQIARVLTIFQVDEVVVYNDGVSSSAAASGSGGGGHQGGAEGDVYFLARVLEYLETPQYLRKDLIRMHRDLNRVGALPPLEAPHHVRRNEWTRFREGIVVDDEGSAQRKNLVNVGLLKPVTVDVAVDPGLRVTVYLGGGEGATKGLVVSPHAPRQEYGMYWGYAVRVAQDVRRAITDAPFADGYDVVIGADDDRGVALSGDNLVLSPFNHLLIVFAGLEGLDAAFEFADEEDLNRDVDEGSDDGGAAGDDGAAKKTTTAQDAKAAIGLVLQVCPRRGSRSVRGEEAIAWTLATLATPIEHAAARR